MDLKVARGLVDSVGREAPAPPAAANPLRGLLPRPSRQHQETAAKAAAMLGQKERERLAEEGLALPDGSFPIRNAMDLEKARIRLHQAKDPMKAKAHIVKRAKALGVKLPTGY